MHTTLAELAEQTGRDIATDEHGIGRVYLRTRASVFPTVEHFYVVCPAVVKDKRGPHFEAGWAAQTRTPQLALFSAVPRGAA